MKEFAPTPRPQSSPWGAIQSARQIATGIWEVSTASHGGIILSQERYDALPAALQVNRYGGGVAFEEDCEAFIPFAYYRDDIARHDAAMADRVAKYATAQTAETVLGDYGSHDTYRAARDWFLTHLPK